MKDSTVLSAFCKAYGKIQESYSPDDLDEWGKHSIVSRRSLEIGLISDHIENGRGISFTCWRWTKKAVRLADKMGLDLDEFPDSYEEYEVGSEED